MHDADVARQAGISMHSCPELIPTKVGISPVMRNKREAAERKEKESIFATMDSAMKTNHMVKSEFGVSSMRRVQISSQLHSNE